MSRTFGSKRSDELSDIELCARVDWLRAKHQIGPMAACRMLHDGFFLQVVEHGAGVTLRLFGKPSDKAAEAWAAHFSMLLRLPQDSGEIVELVRQVRAAHRQKLDNPVETMRKTYTDMKARINRSRESLAAHKHGSIPAVVRKHKIDLVDLPDAEYIRRALAAAGETSLGRATVEWLRAWQEQHKKLVAAHRLVRRYEWLFGVYRNSAEHNGEGAEPGSIVYLTLFGSGVGARIHVELADGRRLVSQRLDPECPPDSIVRAVVATPE